MKKSLLSYDIQCNGPWYMTSCVGVSSRVVYIRLGFGISDEVSIVYFVPCIFFAGVTCTGFRVQYIFIKRLVYLRINLSNSQNSPYYRFTLYSNLFL